MVMIWSDPIPRQYHDKTLYVIESETHRITKIGENNYTLTRLLPYPITCLGHGFQTADEAKEMAGD